jgi:hypothetical protein
MRIGASPATLIKKIKTPCGIRGGAMVVAGTKKPESSIVLVGWNGQSVPQRPVKNDALTA